MEGRAMQTVTCLIRDTARPQVWMEIEIGLDDQDQHFWRLLRTSTVPFNQFTAKKGTWSYATIHVVDKDHDEQSSGIEVEAGSADGFALMGVPKSFYQLNCGQTRSGKGLRDADGADVEYRMDVVCV
jgi:hypothetical protein